MALVVRYKARECPCCGGPGQVKTVNTPHSHGWVGCCTCGLYIQWNWDPHDALDKWNRRTGAQRKWCVNCAFSIRKGGHLCCHKTNFDPVTAERDSCEAWTAKSEAQPYDLLHEEGGVDV